MGKRKLGALLAPIGFFAVALAVTNAGAAVGENIAQLIARYGEPENALALALGVGEWKRQHGVVYAFLEDGRAVLMGYDGVDEKTKETLLERNLPKDQKWIYGKDVKAFLLTHHTNPKVIDEAHFWQTTDGNLWVMYNPQEKSLVVGTLEGIKKMASIAESHQGKGF
jgi:hypothetical protein